MSVTICVDGKLVTLTDAQWAAQNPPASAPQVPDGPTNSDWRVALIQMGRFDDVQKAVTNANESGSKDGQIAYQRWEYANNVYRSELMRLAPLFGFTADEIDQSLTIAAQVAAAAQI